VNTAQPRRKTAAARADLDPLAVPRDREWKAIGDDDETSRRVRGRDLPFLRPRRTILHGAGSGAKSVPLANGSTAMLRGEGDHCVHLIHDTFGI
jgi:hypothetical protein